MGTKTRDVSVVAPLLNEKENIVPLYEQITQALNGPAPYPAMQKNMYRSDKYRKMQKLYPDNTILRFLPLLLQNYS